MDRFGGIIKETNTSCFVWALIPDHSFAAKNRETRTITPAIKKLKSLIHEYFGINLPIIWDVVQNKLGPLETVCRELVEKTAEPDDKEVV